MFKDISKLKCGNKHITSLDSESDLFDTIIRTQSIVQLFNENKEKINDLQMFALFGEWGSGKTTAIEHINSQLDNNLYESFVFETWKYEFGSDLHLSLFENMIDVYNEKKPISSAIKKSVTRCYLLLRNIAKNTSLSTPDSVLSLDVGNALRESLDEWNKMDTPISTYGLLKQFKEDYSKLVKNLIEKDKTLVVFIDDLDRCEPENVISLLSMTKHFFTYNEKVKFVFALDKSAVCKIFHEKYGDSYKGQVYLDKMFDMTFTLDSSVDTRRVINLYFDDSSDIIFNTFLSLDYTNPRSIIKILNKLHLCKYNLMNLINIQTESNDIAQEVIIFFAIYLLVFKDMFEEEFYNLIDIKAKDDFYHKTIRGNYTAKTRDTLIKEPSIILMLMLPYDATLTGIDLNDIAKRYTYLVNKYNNIPYNGIKFFMSLIEENFTPTDRRTNRYYTTFHNIYMFISRN